MTRTGRRSRPAERARTRTARRDALLVLLARADRGVLTRDEARLLRATVETELVEGDAARRAAGGQQAGVLREQHRLVAAEEAIREIEAERDQVAEALRAVCAGEISATDAVAGVAEPAAAEAA